MRPNRRYADKVDRQVSEKILQRIAESYPLQSLTADERQDAVLPVTRDPKPKRCRAWVRFGPQSLQVDGRVVVWNDVACRVLFEVAGVEYRCWVWSNAVSAVPDD